MYIRSKVYHHFNISQNKYKLKLIKGDRAHHILIKGKTYLDVISFLNIYVPRHGHQSLLKKYHFGLNQKWIIEDFKSQLSSIDKSSI